MLLLLAPAATAGPLLVGVVPDLPGPGPGDEGVALAAPGGTSLQGYALTDGESTWAFPANTSLAPGEVAWFVGNLTAWANHGGPKPAGAWPPRALQLANSGDDVALLEPSGAVADAFAWGPGDADAMRFVSPGAVYQRRGHDGRWIDTDQAADWITPRIHRMGQSNLAPISFNVPQVTFYASPDNTLAVLQDLIAGARQRLHLHVYTFRSPELADALAAAKARNPQLDLAIHVASNAISTHESHGTAAIVLESLQEAGARVTAAGGGRYVFHHLKVLVADDAVAIQSENAVSEALAQDGSWGNRGWGVVLHGGAPWFAAWMQEDRTAWDARPFDARQWDPFGAPAHDLPPARGDHRAQPATTSRGPFQVTPVVAPDHTADPATNPILARIGAAMERVWTQQLQLGTQESNRLGWQKSDALLEALLEAARRGVQVRVQLPSPETLQSESTAAAVAYLLDAAAGLDLEVRYLERPSLKLLHNKGFIIDDALVVGSLNGNFHSRAFNREVSVIIEGPDATAYHARLFMDDWKGGTPRAWHVIADDLRAMPAVGPLLFLAAVGPMVWPRWSARARRGARRR